MEIAIMGEIKNYTKYYAKWIIGPYLPRYKPTKRKLLRLRELIPSFMCERLADKPADKRFLIVSMGCYDPATEAIYAKALEAIGYEAHMLIGYAPFVKDIFKIFGISKIHYYEDFYKTFSLKRMKIEAEHYVRSATAENILKFRKNGIQVGKYAASWFMRRMRRSSFDLADETIESLLAECLSDSLRAAAAAEIIVNEVKPDLLFVIDRGYTPVGQLFDACLKQGIPVIQRCASHKSGAEILKRYSTPDMGIIHHHSLSAESWEYIKTMSWSEDLWQKLYNELGKTYKSGDWFSEVGTQFKKVVYSRKELISMLQLDPRKKTAVIFPHMFWDATFFWGKDLFKDYHDWFVNVLKVAARNTNLNWIVKIHPANIVKAKRDNYRGEHSELVAIKEIFGQMPRHIKIVLPESDINTFSFFELMDYCLTVRGTIGIEASALGINTLTAGTGRYDRLGFTYDFDSKEDYLKCISRLEEMLPMSPERIELACKYAYGIFILRPLYLDLLEHGYNRDEKGTIRFLPLFKNREEFEESGFVQQLRGFVMSGKEDYLNLVK